MNDTLTIFSIHFEKNFAIHGWNIHLLASQKKKFKWFLYTIVDEFCDLIYVGCTTDVCAWWAQTKKACLDRNNSNTGLYKHFQDGCPGYRICRLGSFYTHSLNTRDEIKVKSRVNFTKGART